MTPPPIGRLRRRFSLLTATQSTTDAGIAVITWTSTGALWAQVLREALGTDRAGDGAETPAGCILHMRWRADVLPGHRLADGDRLWEVAAVEDPDGTRRGLVCRCEAVPA